LTFTGLTEVISAIDVDNDGLTITLGSVTAVAAVGCQQKYAMKVLSNIVCDECDDVFLDYYRTEAPGSYDGVKWEKENVEEVNPYGNCLCGIRIKGKPFYLEAGECLRDMVGFTETSVRVQASAMYPTNEIREGIGRIPKGAFTGKYLSRFKPRTHLAGNLLDLERMSDAYFLNRGQHNYQGRILLGETSNFQDLGKQYVDYVLEVAHTGITQGFASVNVKTIDYHILAEVGRHQDVEDVINNLAANAGLSPVKAF
jgi:hypothetical protein